MTQFRPRLHAWIVAPQPIERLALLRIVVPLATLGFLSSRLIHADQWLSPVGFRVPDLGGNDWRQPLYLPAIPPWAAWTVAVATAGAGLCLGTGVFTRVSAAGFSCLVAYLVLADRLEAFTVTKIAPVLSLALCFGPADSRYSIAAWWRRRRDPQVVPPTRISGGVVRFFQLFLMVMYSGAGISKLRGGWLTAGALWSHLHDDYQTAAAWLLIRTFPVWTWQALQFLTLAFEVGAPLWFTIPWTRRAATIVGLGMHAMIGLMFGPVIWFALLMSGLLLGCFAPERWLRRMFRAPVDGP